MKQKGFTLIELVVVIVILGILAATALPKFIDLQSDARTAAASGVAGALSSGFSVNYGAYIVNSTKGTRINGTVTLATAADAVMQGGLPSGYSLTAAAASVTCNNSAGLNIPVTVSSTQGGVTNTAGATLICTG